MELILAIGLHRPGYYIRGGSRGNNSEMASLRRVVVYWSFQARTSAIKGGLSPPTRSSNPSPILHISRFPSLQLRFRYYAYFNHPLSFSLRTPGVLHLLHWFGSLWNCLLSYNPHSKQPNLLRRCRHQPLLPRWTSQCWRHLLSSGTEQCGRGMYLSCWIDGVRDHLL